MSKQAPPRSVWSRSAKLMSLAAGLAGKEVGSRLSRAVDRGEALLQQAQRLKTQVEQARAIVASLGQLKGAAMKAGQLLSIELRDVLPPEVIEVLSQLQASGTTVDFAEVRSILLEELGEARLSELDIDPTPLASASIGQVHRARWKGLDLVLKVQFRGIADTIDSDLALLERVARLFFTVQARHFDVTGVFQELREVLVRETDYLHEVEALTRYREKAHQVPGLRVPDVYPELCTRRVLALSWEPGVTLDAWLATSPSLEARNRVAEQVLDLYFREFFDWGLVQTDANFANFLFRPEQGEVVLLDFGATREYPEAFREHYRRLLSASIAGDRARTLEAAVALGLIDPREPAAAQDALCALLDAVLIGFQPQTQPFDFTQRAFVDRAAARLRDYYQALTCSPPPAQLIFLHRKLGGVFSMGRALGARLNLHPYVARLG